MKKLHTLCNGMAVIPLLTLLALPGPGVRSALAAEPTPVITDSLKAQFAALKAKYPKIGAEIDRKSVV